MKSSKFTVYHGCNKNSVKSISEGIVIEEVEEGDFNAKQDGRAFYTTKDQDYAEHWAILKAGPNSIPAVIQFEVDLKDLTVNEFQTDNTDLKYIGKWQTFVSNNWEDIKSKYNRKKKTIDDVVSGFVSNADSIWKDDNKPPKKFEYLPEMFQDKAVTQVAFCSNKALELNTYIVFKGYKLADKEGNWSKYSRDLSLL